MMLRAALRAVGMATVAALILGDVGCQRSLYGARCGCVEGWFCCASTQICVPQAQPSLCPASPMNPPTDSGGADGGLDDGAPDLGGSGLQDKIEIEVAGGSDPRGVDDFVYVSVDGLRRKAWTVGSPEQGVRTDISNWFSAGTHALRLQAINEHGEFRYGVRIFENNLLVVDVRCPATLCDGRDKDSGILFDQTFQLSTPNRPASGIVELTATTTGKLYVNRSFAGITVPAGPTTTELSLPPGPYVFALGVSRDVPPSYTGEFREISVQVSSGFMHLDLGATPPLAVQETTRIVVVPIRNLVSESTQRVATLTDSDIQSFTAQVIATRVEWLNPFSYGLLGWDVTMLPVVEDVPVVVKSSSDVPDLDSFLVDAGLGSLPAQYDMIVFYYSVYDLNNDTVPDVSSGAWADPTQVGINNSWTRYWPRLTGPNPALFHVMLDTYAGRNGALGYYSGIESVSGAVQHGYQNGGNGELDFAQFYRALMRGQVAEVVGMNQNTTRLAPPPDADLWVGIFDAMRPGRQ